MAKPVEELWQAFELGLDRLLVAASELELAAMHQGAGKLPKQVASHVRFRIEIEQNFRRGSKPPHTPPPPNNVIKVDFTQRNQ